MDTETMRKIATIQAKRLGLTGPDTEDCASLFVLRFLVHQASADDAGPRQCAATLPRQPEAWWHCCARNHALNYRRNLKRQRQHLDPWTDLDDDASSGGPMGAPATPLGCCLRQEAHRELDAILHLCSERTRRLFRAHYLEGVSLECLAHEYGMQRNTISQALFQARARLRRQLVQRGWTPGEFATALHGED